MKENKRNLNLKNTFGSTKNSIDQALYRHTSGIFFVPFEIRLNGEAVSGLYIDGLNHKFGIIGIEEFKMSYEICGTDRYVPKNVLKQYESEFLEIDYFRKVNT